MRLLVLIIGTLLAAAPCRAAPPSSGPIEYTVTLDAPQTQMVDVSMRIPATVRRHVDVALPVWRPGRYVVIDPAGTVQDVRARTDAGDARPIEKLDKSTWRITTEGEEAITVDYRVYANSLGDRTRHVDDSHAFLSGSAVFMYATAWPAAPVSVRVVAPEGWRIATGLEPHPDRADTVLAGSYDVLVDSPLEIGEHDRLAFDELGATHEIVIWPTGVDHDPERLVDDFRAIVREQHAIFGELPYRRFVFLVHAAPGIGGGTEHLNSTIMQTARASIEGSIDGSDRYERFLGLVSHELFHTWNVKQFRPAGITPYDYAKENYTRLLWLVEGTTSYYDDLALARAGLIDRAAYLKKLSRAVDRFRSRPGRFVQSLEQSSFDAWIKFNHTTPDSVNSTVSFYRKGTLVSLLLDLEIRRRTANAASLDDVMRRMYVDHRGSVTGYTTADLRETIEAVGGSPFEAFFADAVAGTEPLPLEAALAGVGLELRRSGADEDGHDDDASDPPALRADLGLALETRGGRTLVDTVYADGPSYLAGVMAGDELVAMNGRRIGADDLDGRLDRLAVGDVVTLHLLRRDALRVIKVRTIGRPGGRWVVKEMADRTAEQEQALAAWMASRYRAAE